MRHRSAPRLVLTLLAAVFAGQAAATGPSAVSPEVDHPLLHRDRDAYESEYSVKASSGRLREAAERQLAQLGKLGAVSEVQWSTGVMQWPGRPVWGLAFRLPDSGNGGARVTSRCFLKCYEEGQQHTRLTMYCQVRALDETGTQSAVDRLHSERPEWGAELSHRLIMSIVAAGGVPDSDVTRLQNSNRLGAEGQNRLR